MNLVENALHTVTSSSIQSVVKKRFRRYIYRWSRFSENNCFKILPVTVPFAFASAAFDHGEIQSQCLPSTHGHRRKNHPSTQSKGIGLAPDVEKRGRGNTFPPTEDGKHKLVPSPDASLRSAAKNVAYVFFGLCILSKQQMTNRHETKRYIKSAATRKATEAQGLKLARQLAVIRERARADREALEVGDDKHLWLSCVLGYAVLIG